MNFLQKIETYGDTHHPKWLDLIRIGLGIMLFMKGVYFISDTEAILAMILNSPFKAWAVAIGHYVAIAHLVSGVFHQCAKGHLCRWLRIRIFGAGVVSAYFLFNLRFGSNFGRCHD
jgi:putative oxidoreductase